MTNTDLHFLNAAQDFKNEIVTKIKAETLNALAGINTFLPKLNLDIVFLSAPKTTGQSDPLHIWGFSRNASTIFIYIDVTQPNLEFLIDNELKRVLAHEYHHASRWKSVGYGFTLGEVIVSEGLADHFSGEVFNGTIPKWCQALQSSDIDTWLKKASEQFSNKGYNHQSWFFGDRQGTPRWVGYSLGYFVVKKYLEKNENFTAAKLVDEKAETILAPYQSQNG